ncbi:hypothetical protein [Chryseobacterium sp. SL1]|uniref:hypothetical protein n=1 Tax=Chryseobacterium sp. SL1 TaxID=2995159 RepID=UPI002273667B|nr:hypothetical protein [Chryseobacterium sp. SL1]MCY1660332.1 hypothetical protein [Chryseobacterium sp. SL1]
MSKVIAVGIVAIITLSYTKFLSISEKVTFKEAFDKILEIKIPIFYVLVGVIVYWIVSVIVRKIFKKNSSIYTKKQRKLREFNTTQNNGDGLLYKWNVFFNHQTPFIADLTIFCTKHGQTPIRFIGNKCSVSGCQNSQQEIDMYKLKNLIESTLIEEWEKLK